LYCYLYRTLSTIFQRAVSSVHRGHEIGRIPLEKAISAALSLAAASLFVAASRGHSSARIGSATNTANYPYAHANVFMEMELAERQQTLPFLGRPICDQSAESFISLLRTRPCVFLKVDCSMNVSGGADSDRSVLHWEGCRA
jgi:hypothetical protein